ncbi:MAG TPA: nucleotide exchange factor GrpE [Gemmatimonadales bacterium]|nr:nucleotide exchange factor GrpE [Gemmatimonadales bacterium]
MRKKEFEESALPEEAPVDLEAPDATAEAEAGPAPAAVPMEQPAEMQRRLEDQLTEAQDRLLRLAAEFDNFRKRVARERIELADRAQAALVMRLTEVLDDMDRIVASEAATPGEAILQGMQLVDRKLRKELEGAGLERVDPLGQPFDPTLHEAVSVLPPPAPEQDHVVSAVFQVGYRFKGSLVRPARVQVYASGGHA